ncbi:phosphatidylserine decarboxylase proenzyme, mitochondrial-like isoform X1 [Octopus vulgaris]|uniref:Phosphatidylserine decarboxylase proenzyme, mitochondrial n=1 Tax=Octopus vulgaris TaxID=6645 RepID=A0AA36B007_OCTVU|nr:phosphatidylserine decarboxylase proenzyme, mitochondrial-like isoform X1 [Octopus vulgaris]
MLTAVLVLVCESWNHAVFVYTTLALVLLISRYGTVLTHLILFQTWWNNKNIINAHSSSVGKTHLKVPGSTYNKWTTSSAQTESSTETLSSETDQREVKTELANKYLSNCFKKLGLRKEFYKTKMLLENILIQDSMLFGKIFSKDKPELDEPSAEMVANLPSIIIDHDNDLFFEHLSAFTQMVNKETDWFQHHSSEPQLSCSSSSSSSLSSQWLGALNGDDSFYERLPASLPSTPLRQRLANSLDSVGNSVFSSSSSPLTSCSEEDIKILQQQYIAACLEKKLKDLHKQSKENSEYQLGDRNNNGSVVSSNNFCTKPEQPSSDSNNSLCNHSSCQKHRKCCCPNANYSTSQELQSPHHNSPPKKMKINKKLRNPLKKINKTVTLYRKMPLRSLSRLWGKVNQLDLPVFMRIPVFRIYIWAFGCNIEEAEEEDLKTYRNLGEFFRRTLKPQVRPIDDIHLLTSPSDGTITHFGRVENGVIKQVKGVNFSVEGFIGPVSWKSPFSSSSSSSSLSSSSSQSSSPDSSSMSSSSSLSSSSLREDINNSHNNVNAHIDQNQKILSQLIHPDNVLYHCVIYLAPGDYHRFHSPTDWIVYFRRHFPGELLSVHPGMARWIKGLFNLNERAMYVGLWKHGFFSMTAVGATNVGSIRIYNDHELATNTWKKPDGNNTDKYLPNEQSPGIEVGKGDLFGEFNLGSTIVLIFEAPKDFTFNVEPGQRIKYGEAIGT